MKLALAYSTKDQVELTEQTFPVLRDGQHALFWGDGSREHAGQQYYRKNCSSSTEGNGRLYGGADAAIVWKLSKMLAAEQNYTHIGLIENDVLLDPDWLEPTLELFEKGKADGLDVGAVSPRSYVDRVLIQRDGYAVMHNIGAGAIIFTREAAEIVLHSFRTHWWPDNRKLFAQLSGIDLATYAAFGGNEQFVTTDWGWEAQLARHGLASLALTPAKCQMIGQNPPLHEQGLTLTTGTLELRRDETAFGMYCDSLSDLRKKYYHAEFPGLIMREGAGMLFFAHQLPMLNACWFNKIKLKWSQGFGPFAYVADSDATVLRVHVSGACALLVSGGETGARVVIEDERSGFKTSPDLPAGSEPIAIQVPVTRMITRMITCKFDKGAVFYGLQTVDLQILNATWKFDWAQLPEMN